MPETRTRSPLAAEIGEEFARYLLETQGDPYLSRSVIAFDSRQRLDTFLQALQAIADRLLEVESWQELLG